MSLLVTVFTIIFIIIIALFSLLASLILFFMYKSFFNCKKIQVPSPLPEIKNQVKLCKSVPGDALALNVAAIGWSRSPIYHEPNLTESFLINRVKQWEYYGIYINDGGSFLGITIAHIGYVSTHSIYFYDSNTRQAIAIEAVVPLGLMKCNISETREDVEGRIISPPLVRAFASDLSGSFVLAMTDDPSDGSTRIVGGTAGGLEIDITIAPREGDCLAVVVPWNSSQFQYTVKDVARKVRSGIVKVDGVVRESVVTAGWAVLDRGRGRWPYRMRWNWCCGSGTITIEEDQRVVAVGLQMGAKWTRGTGSSECAFLLDKKIYFLGEEPEMEYDLTNAESSIWRVRGTRIDATMKPSGHVRRDSTNIFGFLKFSVVQVFGLWSGRVKLESENDEWFEFSNLIGWAEEADNAW